MLTEYIAFPFAFAYILCAGGSKSDNRTSEVIRTNIILLSFIVVNPPVSFDKIKYIWQKFISHDI